MTLKEQISSDLVTAMKAHDELGLSTLRMLKAAIMKYEVSGANMTATDEVVAGLLKKEIKMRQDGAEGFQKGGNTAAAEKEMQEAELIKKYLPAEMSEEAVRAEVQKIIDTMKPTPADFGKVMGAVMAQLKGKADGGVVNRVVKEMLKG